jgi:hypothetical protein
MEGVSSSILTPTSDRLSLTSTFIRLLLKDTVKFETGKIREYIRGRSGSQDWENA